MTEQEGTVHAVLFPSLNDQDEKDITVHSHEIKASPALLKRMPSYCKSQGIPVARLVQAAWAIVVQQYAETEYVLMSAEEVRKRHAMRVSNTASEETEEYLGSGWLRCVGPTGRRLLRAAQAFTTEGRMVADVIRQHATERPQATAIDAWDGQVSYEELNRLTARLGQRLYDAGVGPGVMVPVCFPRSLWAIVAEGAVLQVGGAFVPIDPAHPTERMNQIVNQTKARLALTAPSFADHMATLVDQVIMVSLSLKEDRADEDLPCLDIDLDSPAYILFTSGSTGQPKGCVVPHCALGNVLAQASALHLRSDSRAFQFTSYSFGVSLIEIYCVLTASGTICIPSDTNRLNRLTETMQMMRISWAYLTTATAASLHAGEELAELQTPILTGEPLDPRQVRKWAPRVQLWQGFGCTECAGVFAHGQSVAGLIPRIPTAWRPPAQTAAAFLQQLDWWEALRPGVPCRLYRTGDLVQYESDGSLRYITRRDTQVKVRGMCVELGEIEYQIRRTAELDRVVAEAAVPADGHEGPALVAFLHSSTMPTLGGKRMLDGSLLWTDDPKGFVLLAAEYRPQPTWNLARSRELNYNLIGFET
ncbi:acetyl-CoA synthetase-like protein [Aspergillus affinis]|uniref:acetyl-CoA synthetase-like protein n=1 Tax=Aspergillus affinis TaxID=1070780 RepID=UPI0022FE09BD|nr:acetyl-CoA synthetase-like protein [Aspergillus affinis]KAI9035209.1 acetyl-CoA synthetase-like protein [Aspergillus affinis]